MKGRDFDLMILQSGQINPGGLRSGLPINSWLAPVRTQLVVLDGGYEHPGDAHMFSCTTRRHLCASAISIPLVYQLRFRYTPLQRGVSNRGALSCACQLALPPDPYF